MAGCLFKKSRFFLVPVVILLLIPCAAEAGKPELSNIIVTNTRDDLLLYFNATGLFTSDLQRAVLNGIPSRFVFSVSLYQVRNLWPDQKLTQLEIEHTIKYDSLRTEFTVTRSEYDRPVVVKSFVEARKLIANIDDFAVIPLKELPKGYRYQIRLKAVLDKGSVPFLVPWNIQTDRHTLDFIY